MGIYVNPGNMAFRMSRFSEIYVDKSMLIAKVNAVYQTEKRFLCVSRPRRFGKSMAANMLSAYYSRGCDSRDLFSGLKIEWHPSFQANLNQRNVIRLDIQQFLESKRDLDTFITEIERTVTKELMEAFQEFLRAVKTGGWDGLMQAFAKSEELLKSTWALDGNAVAAGMAAIHDETASLLKYNDENSLTCTILMAYYSARAYYMNPVLELPSGKGYADVVYLPKRDVGKPALIIELKWDKSAEGAIRQIQDRQYASWVDGYTGEILLVGINYGAPFTCTIEKIQTDAGQDL